MPSAERDAGEALSADDGEAIATFDAALAELETIQTDDFAGLFRAWTACRSSSA